MIAGNEVFMKILHYINNLAPGGAEKLLTDILPLMQKEGHEIHLAYCNNRNNLSEFDEKIKRGGVYVINFNKSYYNPIQIFMLIRLIVIEKYDIIHTHLFQTQYWLALASLFISTRTKLITTEHNILNRRRKFRILRLIEKFIYSRYHTIIAITNNVKERLELWLERYDNIVVINNGINLHEMQLLKDCINHDEYDFLRHSKFNILMVGRFDYSGQKDQTSLVMALSLLPDNYELFFAGGGDYIKEIEKLVSDLNLARRVHFLGIREDVYKLMSLVDLNVLSTNFEGLSGVALESMASGRPFIGTDVAGVNDVVPDSQFLFPKNDPGMLAAKIKEVSKNKELDIHLIKSGLEHVKKYDIIKMVYSYLDIYQSTIDEDVNV